MKRRDAIELVAALVAGVVMIIAGLLIGPHSAACDPVTIGGMEIGCRQQTRDIP